MDITGNSVVKMLKNANLKKGFNGFQIASIPLEICFIVFKIQHVNQIRQCKFTHCQYETKVYKTRYIFAIVFYDHAQINYRVNRALLMETCQSKNYTMIFPLCTKIQEKVILRVGESGRFFQWSYPTLFTFIPVTNWLTVYGFLEVFLLVYYQ